MLCYVGAGLKPAPTDFVFIGCINKRAGLRPAPTMIIVIF